MPSFLSPLADEIGRFELDSAGQLVTKGTQSLPFTLCLPMLNPADDGAALPLIVFQHGLGRDRSDVLPLANELNAAGYAVLAIDAPYHGMRHPSAVDRSHRFDDRALPDGFVDWGLQNPTAWFLGDSAGGGDRAPFHPEYLRDALRQNVSDWAVALRTLTASPFPEVPGLPAISFAVDRIGFVGVDIGGQVGLMLSSIDPRVDAGLLALTGGGLAEWLIDSPAVSSFAEGLFEQLGMDPQDVNVVADSPLDSPALSLWQTLVDPGDALAFAPSLRRKPRDLLIVMARDDEHVSNRTTEALAAALRVPIAGAGTPRFVELPRIATPVAGNALIAGELATQALFELLESTHTVYSAGHGVRVFEATPTWPFSMRAEPLSVDNPIEPALTQAVFFFESWREGSATVIDPLVQLRTTSQ